MKRHSLLKVQTSENKSSQEYPKVQNLGKLRAMHTKTVNELSEDIEEKVIKLETLME